MAPQNSLTIPIAESIDYSPNAIVSRTLIKQGNGSVTLFALDAGQEISEHTTPYEAIAHIVEGSAVWSVGGKMVSAPQGHVVMLPASVPHAVTARERFKMLLTMIRGEPSAR